MKQTEIGVIPEDWEVVNLEKNFTLKARIGWQGLTTAEYLASGDYGLVTGTDFLNGYIDWDNCVFVEKERYVQDKNIQLKVGDVLVTKDGTIGKVAYINNLPKPTTLNSGVFVVRPKNQNVNNKFFYYILMSFYFDEFLSKITAGSTITHLYQKDFVHFNFVLPPLAEQEAIANALSDADAWIEKLEQLIVKKRLIKQGAMQTLLTPKEDWEVKKLGEVAKIYQPQTISNSSFTSEGYLVYGANGIIGKYNSYNHKLWQVTITCRGSTCGTVNKTENEVWITGNAMVINVDDNYSINKLFLFYLLNLCDFTNCITGSGQPQIVRAPLFDFEISFPSLSEQERIATILSDMDAEIEALEQQLGKARHIKQGMMQELLTGRTRLV